MWFWFIEARNPASQWTLGGLGLGGSLGRSCVDRCHGGSDCKKSWTAMLEKEESGKVLGEAGCPKSNRTTGSIIYVARVVVKGPMLSCGMPGATNSPLSRGACPSLLGIKLWGQVSARLQLDREPRRDGACPGCPRL